MAKMKSIHEASSSKIQAVLNDRSEGEVRSRINSGDSSRCRSAAQLRPAGPAAE